MKKIKTFLFLTVFTLSSFNVFTQTSSLISNCGDFVSGPTAWPYVLVATTPDSGVASQGAQTFTMNVTDTASGASFRVAKTTANGNWFFGPAIPMTLGSNSITVAAVTFDRAVKFQFSNGDVEFDALVLNGDSSGCVLPSPPPPPPTSSLISNCGDFVSGPTAWPYVLVATTPDSGVASQGAQTFTMNVTDTASGASFRVAKTTANGNWFFGPAIPMTLGSNSITVAAVTFDRAVKFQFSNGDVEFDALVLNGDSSGCVLPSPPPPPPTSSLISNCGDFVSGPTAWPYVLVATTPDSGVASQGAQTFTMNVTDTASGASFRVAKTTANGNWFFGPAIPMTLGSNSITVAAVTFDRAVKFQFSNGDVEFDALVLNGVATNCICASYSVTDMVMACDSYTWIDGITYTSSNNTATDTLISTAGCDSVITLDLTITSSYSATDVVMACDSYTWIDGITYTSSNNTATDTLISTAGCDSVITLDLTITSSYSATDVVMACDSYTWIDGITYTSSNNTATDTLISTAGCDSVITLDLTITSSYLATDVVMACDSYTWIDGITYTSSNNTATDTLISTAGCDSVITLDLTITSLNASVIVINDTTLQSQSVSSGVVYQWVDCNNNYAPILGETNATFSTQTPGDYAVEISLNNCSVISDCYTIAVISSNEVLNSKYGIQLFPNPTTNDLILSLKGVNVVDIVVVDTHGRVLLKQSNLFDQDRISLSTYVAGTYFVKIITPEQNKTIAITKQ